MQYESRRALRKRRSRRKVTVFGVLGELLITAGVVVMLFLGWQVWFNDLMLGNQQQSQATELRMTWQKGEATAPAQPEASRPDPGEPEVTAAPANAVTFGNLIVPRFGKDWSRPIAEGVGIDDVLNTIGIGHYPGTQMPGELGNFAVAGHRTGWGSPLVDIDKLRVGDSIYVETAAGWYRYEFRSNEYVTPAGVGVLDPVPQAPGVPATDRFITITSCNPLYSVAERIIAYGVYDTWYPRSEGPPEEIAHLVVQGA